MNDPAIKGWEQKSILDTYVERWSTFVEAMSSTYPFGISPEAIDQSRQDLSAHNLIMSYGYALGVASASKPNLSILDWGGGIGHYYVISKALRPDLNIDYSCKDFRLFVEHGQKLFPEAHFYFDDAWKQRQYDFVLASGSIHYSQDWQDVVKQLAHASTGYVFVTRLPVIQHKPSFVMVQRPYKYGYNTEYLGWCLNRTELLDCAKSAQLSLVREFVVEYPPYIQNAPEQCDYWGFLFKKAN